MPGDHSHAQHFKTADRIWRPVAFVLIVITVIGLAILASTPPVSKDALTHHLALPKIYVARGVLVELPDRVFSYYPMNLDLLYMIPLWMGNDILAKYIHFSFSLLTALIIYRFLKKRIGSGYGLFGVLLFLSTPMVLKLSITVYVDLGLLFFSTASLLALLEWRRGGFKTRDLLWASVWCGLALGTKYHGLIVFFFLVNILLLVSARKISSSQNSTRRTLGHASVFIIIALIIFSPWMIRNMVWKSNPIYPLFNASIQALSRDGSAPPPAGRNVTQSADRPIPLNHFSYRANAFNESGLDIAMIPLRIFYQGRDGTPQYFDGRLNLLLLLLPLFAFVNVRGDPDDSKIEKQVLLLFAAGFILVIFVSIDMRIRYILPAVPPLAILAAYGLRSLITLIAKITSPVGRPAALGVVCLLIAGFLLSNGFYLAGLFKTVQPLAYLRGQVTRDAYIERFRPALSVHRYAGRNLAADARILGLFLGNRSYYSDRDLVFDNGLFLDTVRQAEDAAQIAARLRTSGLTHLLIRYDLFVRWANDNFTPVEKKRVQLFFDEVLSSLYAGRGYGLYAL